MGITVVDAIMGSGKSSKAIQMMNENSSTTFIYVTPLLSEVDRICNNVVGMCSCSASWSDDQRTKLEHLKELLSQGKSVSITHSLFHTLDSETVNIIASLEKSCLIIDETVDCYQRIKISKANIDMMVDNNLIFIEKDNSGKNKVVLGQYIKGLSQCEQYFHLLEDRDVYVNSDNELMIAMLPSGIYNSVDDAFIMTYNFEDTDMHCYLTFNDYDFKVEGIKNCNGNYRLVPFVETSGAKYKDLITICDNPKMNAIGNLPKTSRKKPLSKSWYMSPKVGSAEYNILRKNCVNFFKNISQTKPSENMFTTFKDGDNYEYARDDSNLRYIRENFDGKLKKGRKWIQQISDYPFKDTKDNQCFVPFNTRATNEFSDKKALAFLVDVHYDLGVKSFFSDYDIYLDNEKYALNTLLQWLWRSRIRKGEHVHLYIPSQRMRKLLMEWLEYEENERF